MSGEGDWLCSSCQHLNFKRRDSCQRCRCTRFGGGTALSSYGISKAEVLAGDWYCSVMNCGAHNYASRISCYRCGAIKSDYSAYAGGGGMVSGGGCFLDGSGLPGWKSGDWMCTRFGCGVHNYARRTECFKCGTPRDFGASV